MWRFNLRERWKARTYTPFALFPLLWIIVAAFYLIWAWNSLGLGPSALGNSDLTTQWDTEHADLESLLVDVTLIGGSVVAFRRRRTRRWWVTNWGWRWKWRWVRLFDGRFHLFPFGPLKRLRLTEAGFGDFNGAACASFSLWPRWQVLRRFYDVDLVELPAVLPGLALFPMGQYDRTAAALGGADIETESEAFNAEWRVVARDERYALALLHPLMIEELLKPAYRDLPITIDGGAILTWHPGRARFTELGARLALLRNLAALIPRHVWDDFGTSRPEPWGQPGTLFRPGWESVPVNPMASRAAALAGAAVPPLVNALFGVHAVHAGSPVLPAVHAGSPDPVDLDAETPVDTSQTFYPAGDSPAP
jgi:hypothetical protein